MTRRRPHLAPAWLEACTGAEAAASAAHAGAIGAAAPPCAIGTAASVAAAADPARTQPVASSDLSQTLQMAGEDLERLQTLLADAGTALAEGFEAAATEIRRLAGADRVAGCRSLQRLAAAAAALQFQDIARQLISHTQQRLAACNAQARPPPAGAPGGRRPRAQPRPPPPNPVTQSRMDAGPVELF